MKATALTFSLLLPAALIAGCGGGGQQGGFSVQVVAEEAKAEKIDEIIPLVGTLAANEAVEIKAETDGKVEKILFSEGQYVKAGQILMVIEGAKLAAQVGQAEATYKFSSANKDRAESLVQNNTISQQEYDQALSRFESDKATLDLMRQELEDATVRAPFSGRVGSRLVSPGQVVAKGTQLTTLIDANPMKVEFSVPERYAGKVSTKLTVDVQVSPYPNKTFVGDVYFVSPLIDPNTRTLLVKAKIKNNEGLLRPGLFANIELKLDTIPDAVVVPESALIKQADSIQLYAVSAENTADLRTVTTGVRMKGRVQITDGLMAGEKVITEGNQKVRPGAPVSFNASAEPEPAPEAGTMKEAEAKPADNSSKAEADPELKS